MKSIYIYFIDETVDIYYKDNENNFHTTLNIYTNNSFVRSEFRKNLLDKYWDKREIKNIEELKLIVKESFVQIITSGCENIGKNDKN